jgi:hypothetical protein
VDKETILPLQLLKTINIDAQGCCIWVLKALESIEKGGNLYNILKQHNKANVDDPEDVMNWTWAQFKQYLYSSSLAKGIDPLEIRAVDELEAVECASTSKEDIEDFKDAFENAFEDYEADESCKYLGLSDVATQMISMIVAQLIYNKSPKVLQSIMDEYKNNDKELYGKRTDLQQMYDVLDKVKTSPLIPALLAAAAPQKSINSSVAHSTYPQPDKTQCRIASGTKDDYVVMMKVHDARVSEFETALSKLVVSHQNFKCRQLPKTYGGDKTAFVVVHPQQSALELFSASSTCGARPGKLGVARNVTSEV